MRAPRPTGGDVPMKDGLAYRHRQPPIAHGKLNSHDYHLKRGQSLNGNRRSVYLRQTSSVSHPAAVHTDCR